MASDKCFVCETDVPIDSLEAIDLTMANGEKAVVCSAEHWSVLEQAFFERKVGTNVEFVNLVLSRKKRA